MKSSKYSKVVYLNGHYVFKDNIDRVFEIYRSPVILTEIQKEFLINARKISGPGNYYDDVNTVFYLECKYGANSLFIIEDAIKTPNYKMFQIFAYDNGVLDIQYRMKFSFYYCRDEGITLFYQEMWYYFNGVLIIPHSQKDYDKDLVLKSRLVEKYLRSFYFGLDQTESVTIQTSIDKVCNVITDWGKFAEFVPRIAEEVVITDKLGDISRRVTHVKFKNFEYKLRVIKYFKTPIRMEFHLLPYDSVPKIPNQELQFTVIKLNEEKTFVQFKHVFKENLRRTTVNKIQDEKRLILTELKQALES